MNSSAHLLALSISCSATPRINASLTSESYSSRWTHIISAAMHQHLISLTPIAGTWQGVAREQVETSPLHRRARPQWPLIFSSNSSATIDHSNWQVRMLGILGSLVPLWAPVSEDPMTANKLCVPSVWLSGRRKRRRLRGNKRE